MKIRGRSDEPGSKRPRGRKTLAALTASVLFEGTALWLRTGRVGGNVIVRCRQGHLFTTLWIPAASIKSIRLGFWRVQRCPVCHRWTIVTPVRETALSDEERLAAGGVHDLRLP